MVLPFVDKLFELIKLPLERLVPDKNARDKLALELEQAAIEAGLAQADINKKEAEHASLFVAGWRPFVGWVCGFALAWHFIFYDFLIWCQAVLWPDLAPPPVLTGSESLVTVLLSMLGLGGLRTVEKLKGVSRLR